MSKNFDCNLALETLSEWLDNYSESDGRKCRCFFGIISKIRLALELINELLRRIEELESKINSKNE